MSSCAQYVNDVECRMSHCFHSRVPFFPLFCCCCFSFMCVRFFLSHFVLPCTKFNAVLCCAFYAMCRNHIHVNKCFTFCLCSTSFHDTEPIGALIDSRSYFTILQPYIKRNLYTIWFHFLHGKIEESQQQQQQRQSKLYAYYERWFRLCCLEIDQTLHPIWTELFLVFVHMRNAIEVRRFESKTSRVK